MFRKVAQKCYCGSECCRGYIGGENANILTDGSKIPKKLDKKEEEEHESDEEEFEDIGVFYNFILNENNCINYLIIYY